MTQWLLDDDCLDQIIVDYLYNVFKSSTYVQVWNRDVSAAKNMLRCLMAKVEMRERPGALRRAQALPNDGLMAAEQDNLVEAQDAVLVKFRIVKCPPRKIDRKIYSALMNTPGGDIVLARHSW
jgi:hypothetical protein